MKNRQNDILAFCVDGKKSHEIAEHCGLVNGSVYMILRTLQKMGVITKDFDSKRRGVAATFTTVSTHRPTRQFEGEYDPELVNVDFIRHSHNIWRTAT